MADDQYVIPKPAEPDRTQLVQHPKEQRRANSAIGIALLAAIFTLFQAWEAHQARIDARSAADLQKQDVERSRRAAEASAIAAQQLASTGNRAASASEKAANAAAVSASSGEQSLTLTRREMVLGNAPGLNAIDSRISTLITKDVTPSVMTRIYNGGKGVAVQFSAREWMNLASHLTFEYEGASSQDKPSTEDIPVGDASKLTMVVKWPRPLTAEEAGAINAGRLKLYVYGVARYADGVFDKKPRHYVWHWCYWYDPNRPIPDAMLLTVCPEHNFTSIQ